MIIRHLYSWDVPEVVPLLKAFNEEAGDLYPFDAVLTESFIRSLFRDGTGTVLAAYDGDKLIGVLGAIINYYPGTLVKRVNELFFYVRPESRGGMTAVRLLKAYEQWAFGLGAAAVQMVALRATDPEGKVADLYKALGYEEVEICYLRKRPT